MYVNHRFTPTQKVIHNNNEAVVISLDGEAMLNIIVKIPIKQPNIFLRLLGVKKYNYESKRVHYFDLKAK